MLSCLLSGRAFLSYTRQIVWPSLVFTFGRAFGSCHRVPNKFACYTVCDVRYVSYTAWLVRVILLSAAQCYLGLLINEGLLMGALTAGLRAYIHCVPGTALFNKLKSNATSFVCLALSVQEVL